MNIKRNEQQPEQQPAPAQAFGDLDDGTVFKIGKKLYLKTTQGAARLTSGFVDEDVLTDTLVTQTVNGTFVYD